MIVEPKIRGFICTTAHPVGCAANVQQQVDYVNSQGKISTNIKNVLVIGASTGYGLASRIVSSFGCGANTLGVFFEKEASGKRPASAGWYNSCAFEKLAHQKGIYAKSINGDAFSNEVKQQAINIIKDDWNGKVDLVVYSLASPRRQDPETKDVYNSVLKPIDGTYENKTVDVITGKVSDVSIETANEDEIAATVKVMGGEDWQLWIEALANAEVLSENALTVAYSYIGPELTYPVYRNGTIGKAKEHLETTARELDILMQNKCKGRALVSVNKGLVTQASSAIPVVPLYLAMLYKVMKQHGTHEGTIEQIYRLFKDRLYTETAQNNLSIDVDSSSRIRIDDWEMDSAIQQKIQQMWNKVDSDNLAELTDLQSYSEEFYKLFGFKVTGVDYSADVDIDVMLPSVEQTVA